MTLDKITPAHANTPIPAGRYRLAPELTTVSFSAKKFGVFTISGTMAVTSGSFTVGEEPERSSLHAVLAADTFRTPMANRDKHVKGTTLLDVASHPTIEFDSTEVVATPAGWEVHGLLTVHGTVAPVALSVTAATQEGAMVRLSAEARIDRRSFGVTRMRLAAASLVEIHIEAVGTPMGTEAGAPGA